MKLTAAHIDLFMEMLSIPSISRDEGRRADFLEAYLRNTGHRVERVKNNLLVGTMSALDAQENLESKHDPVAKKPVKTLLLNSHIDTVPPTDGWSKDPYSPVMEGNRITGLGSNDAGASVIALLATYEALADVVKDSLNLVLVLSAEEEVSGQDGISSLVAHLGHVDGAIVGEPTKMQPAIAERGLMVIDALVKGKAGHAARGEGDNAIYKALEDISEIERLVFTRRSEWLPAPSAQVTMIASGTKHNVVPDECRFVVDVRSNDIYSNRDILDMLKSKCQGQLAPRSMRLNASSLPEDHFLHEAIRASGLTPFGSQTLSDMAVIPWPAIKMGPGDSARSHTADEYISIDEIEQGVEGYIGFVNTIMTLQT